MIKKNATTHLTPVNPVVTNTKTSPFLSRGLGAILLAMSLSVFAQGIPLMFVFIGAYLGVPAEAKIGDMDTMVWLLTSLTMMILVLYAFISWMKFLWRRFVTNPVPFRFFRKKEKHAQ